MMANRIGPPDGGGGANTTKPEFQKRFKEKKMMSEIFKT